MDFHLVGQKVLSMVPWMAVSSALHSVVHSADCLARRLAEVLVEQKVGQSVVSIVGLKAEQKACEWVATKEEMMADLKALGMAAPRDIPTAVLTDERTVENSALPKAG